MSQFPPSAGRDEGPSEADIARAETVALERERPARPFLARMWKPLAALAGLLLAASLLVELLVFLPRRNDQQRPPELVSATVTRVIDGRTLEAEVHGGAAVIRYIGIGAPGIGSEYSGLVLDLNRQWVGGREVMLENDAVDKDPEGRLLRYVYVDGAMVNAALIAAGFAWAEDSGLNRRYSEGFAQLEATARAERRGLWARGAGFKGTAVPRPLAAPEG
jgi:endonuclease YncB( thermonuclease family)